MVATITDSQSTISKSSYNHLATALLDESVCMPDEAKRFCLLITPRNIILVYQYFINL